MPQKRHLLRILELLCTERIPSDVLACLIFEGGTPHQNGYPIVTSRKGRAEYLISVEGRGAHAGNYHKQGANAIVQIAETIKQIASLTNYDEQLTFNVGVVKGGSVVNRVPHYAEAMVEMRAFTPEIFENGYLEDVVIEWQLKHNQSRWFPLPGFC